MDFLTRTANTSATVFQHWAERIGGGDPGFRQVGVLWLVGPDRAENLRANVRRARELGANVVTLSPGEVQALVPAMAVDDVALGAYEAESGLRGRRDDHERLRDAGARAGGDGRPVRGRSRRS